VADIYADDTTITYSTHFTAAPNHISDGLQTDIDEILNWSADNKMILNETKTKSSSSSETYRLLINTPCSQLAELRENKVFTIKNVSRI